MSLFDADLPDGIVYRDDSVRCRADQREEVKHLHSAADSSRLRASCFNVGSAGLLIQAGGEPARLSIALRTRLMVAEEDWECSNGKRAAPVLSKISNVTITRLRSKKFSTPPRRALRRTEPLAAVVPFGSSINRFPRP